MSAVHPAELGSSEWARWRDLQACAPSLAGPYFSPGWTQAVGAARADARVVIVESGAAITAFFAAQRPSMFAAMPIGAPLCDYQGVIGAAEGVRPAALCRALAVGRIDFCHMLSSDPAFGAHGRGVMGSWIAETDAGRAAYLAAIRERRPDFVRKLEKKRRRLVREHGEILFTPEDGDEGRFALTLQRKAEQSRMTGQPHVWETGWVRTVLAHVRRSREADFRPVFATLARGDDLIAGCLLLASRDVLHAWIIAHDHRFDAYSPGVMLAYDVCGWAADNGFSHVDFGAGDYQFKRQVSTSQIEVCWGFAGAPSFSAAWRGVACAGRRTLEQTRLGLISELPGRAMRRLDAIRGLGSPQSSGA